MEQQSMQDISLERIFRLTQDKIKQAGDHSPKRKRGKWLPVLSCAAAAMVVLGIGIFVLLQNGMTVLTPAETPSPSAIRAVIPVAQVKDDGTGRENFTVSEAGVYYQGALCYYKLPSGYNCRYYLFPTTGLFRMPASVKNDWLETNWVLGEADSASKSSILLAESTQKDADFWNRSAEEWYCYLLSTEEVYGHISDLQSEYMEINNIPALRMRYSAGGIWQEGSDIAEYRICEFWVLHADGGEIIVYFCNNEINDQFEAHAQWTAEIMTSFFLIGMEAPAETEAVRASIPVPEVNADESQNEIFTISEAGIYYQSALCYYKLPSGYSCLRYLFPETELFRMPTSVASDWLETNWFLGETASASKSLILLAETTQKDANFGNRNTEEWYCYLLGVDDVPGHVSDLQSEYIAVNNIPALRLRYTMNMRQGENDAIDNWDCEWWVLHADGGEIIVYFCNNEINDQFEAHAQWAEEIMTSFFPIDENTTLDARLAALGYLGESTETAERIREEIEAARNESAADLDVKAYTVTLQDADSREWTGECSYYLSNLCSPETICVFSLHSGDTIYLHKNETVIVAGPSACKSFNIEEQAAPPPAGAGTYAPSEYALVSCGDITGTEACPVLQSALLHMHADEGQSEHSAIEDAYIAQFACYFQAKYGAWNSGSFTRMD